MNRLTRQRFLLVGFLLGVLVVGATPQFVYARAVNALDLPTIVLDVPQSFFEGIGCEFREPYWSITDLYQGSPWFDVPDNSTATTSYIGMRQPMKSGTFTKWFCDRSVVDQKIKEEGIDYLTQAAPGSGTSSILEESFVTMINWILSLAATLGVYIMWLGSKLLAPLLGMGSFITNPLVTAGWPFMLGVANLGFLVALLFIAFATTLGIESINARRLLPRLLMAALVINFSLIIAGAIIDISRLVMAIFLTSVLGKPDLESLTLNLIESSHLVTKAFNVGTYRDMGFLSLMTQNNSSWEGARTVLQATILIWLLAMSFIILIVGLFVRYIALVMLLIVSPFAYLSFAFPNAEGFSRTWWSNFLKYVFYGPIAIFILALAVKVSEGLAGSGPLQVDSFWQDAVNMIIVSAMMYTAAKAGSKFGMAGSNATLDFLTKRTKQAAYVGSGARFVQRQAGDFSDAAKKSIRNVAKQTPLVRYFVPAKRDDKGKLKEGEKSIGSTLANAAFGRVDPESRRKRGLAAAAVTAAQGPGGVAANLNDNAISPTMLRYTEVKKALDKDDRAHITAILNNTTSVNQIRAVVRDENYVKGLDDARRNELRHAIQTNVTVGRAAAPGVAAGLTDRDRDAAIDDLLKTIDNIAKKS